MPTTALKQVVSYLKPSAKAKLQTVRLRAQKRTGAPISESRYVATVLERHLAKLAN
jgi:hypothetical protein